MRKIIKRIIFFLILALLVFPVYYFIRQINKKHVEYDVSHPQKRKIENFIISSGFIVPKEEVEIKTIIPGVLNEIFVKLGDSFSKNQPIAEIKVVPNLNQLSVLESNLNKAQLNFENQKMSYKRQKHLFSRGII